VRISLPSPIRKAERPCLKLDMEAAAPLPVKGSGNLNNFIEKTSLECLNECEAHPVGHAFDSEPGTYLSSDPDTDSQLLISVAFRVPVKISHVKVTVPPEALENRDFPGKIKLFVGKDDTMGFDEAEERKATEELDVRPGEDMQVKFVKFQGVRWMKVFVSGSAGGDVSKIKSLEFIGIPQEALDMADWKPIKG